MDRLTGESGEGRSGVGQSGANRDIRTRLDVGKGRHCREHLSGDLAPQGVVQLQQMVLSISQRLEYRLQQHMLEFKH
jgi:hypothetical protein